jgi:hypothetical protein
MVTSSKQIRANKENAKKGGVKSEKGKSISRFNALKHGIFTNVAFHGDNQSEIYQQIRERIFDELKPVGVLEEIHVDFIVLCVWRRRRCVMTDKGVTDDEVMTTIAMPIQGRTELLLRYETTIGRQMYRAMRELRELQRIRLDFEQKALP